MDGSCQVPIAGYATVDNGDISFTGLISSPDSLEVYKENAVGRDPIETGRVVADRIISQGGYDLIQKVKAENHV
jgi:hydroxymethylbilane synthase